MKKKIGICLAILFASYGCNLTDETPIVEAPLETVSKVSLDQTIQQTLIQKQEFSWEWVSSAHVAAALASEDSILTIGYQPAGFRNLNETIQDIDVSSEAWVNAKRTVLNEIQKTYDAMDANIDVNDQIVLEHQTLPYIKIKAHEAVVVEKLRNLATVRYSEPATYTYVDAGLIEPEARTESGSGCGSNGADNINGGDFTTISPGAKQPWNYSIHKIPQAWAYSQGDNIGVGVIDTGISPDQSKLNSQFSSGNSTGRYVNKFGTYVDASWWQWWRNSPDGPNDKCGHGTQMSGAISAPRTSSGSSVGVAYKANLLSVRGTSDVVINASREKDGVSDALVLLGNRSDVRIISMSIGDIFSSGQVKDAIRYANNRGKLIFAAAGTSTTFTNWYGVIFPATMSETVAVTGIKDNGYNRCNICHDGSKVDFAITMQRASSGSRTSLTLADSGNTPSYVGGSSVATAQTAGIAALVWARNPSQSKAQVLDKLKRAGEFYPNRNNNFGWGKIDALKAVTF
ncbi:MAG: S8/S53 family peptidase [Bacteroidota bacterium]